MLLSIYSLGKELLTSFADNVNKNSCNNNKTLYINSKMQKIHHNKCQTAFFFSTLIEMNYERACLIWVHIYINHSVINDEIELAMFANFETYLHNYHQIDDSFGQCIITEYEICYGCCWYVLEN